jgi:hypothetical protein
MRSAYPDGNHPLQRWTDLARSRRLGSVATILETIDTSKDAIARYVQSAR